MMGYDFRYIVSSNKIGTLWLWMLALSQIKTLNHLGYMLCTFSIYHFHEQVHAMDI